MRLSWRDPDSWTHNKSLSGIDTPEYWAWNEFFGSEDSGQSFWRVKTCDDLKVAAHAFCVTLSDDDTVTNYVGRKELSGSVDKK